MTGYKGTYQDNRRPVITTAPDALVFLNGELALPSGGNPSRQVNIQPLINSISIDLSVDGAPGSASISLHIPAHYKEDFFRGSNLILTTMMEVHIYLKGHFMADGQPRYYPSFWGVVTSVNESWSGGETTVDLSCQDILYWWTVQRITTQAAVLGQGEATQNEMNKGGAGAFTGMNPFDIMYSLTRQAHGDAVFEENYLGTRQQRPEPSGAQDDQMMAYWQKKWGRITKALRMYGPQGDVLLSDVESSDGRQRVSLNLGTSADAIFNRPRHYKPFEQAGIDLTSITPFKTDPSNLFGFDLHTAQFQTKKEISDTVKEAINYEFFMDVNGELVFKPPFYNLDVMPNKPVSWIRPIDIINHDFAENPPDVTMLEASAAPMMGMEIDADDIAVTRATYVDYRLVQKYGWKPGNYSSDFVGADFTQNNSRTLFLHLVDELDRENLDVRSGSVSIPIRPELRLGYPIYHQQKDAYYYVSGISHQFSYGGQCTTSLTLRGERKKFYADFPYWRERVQTDRDDLNLRSPSQVSTEDQPPTGQQADPGMAPRNIWTRPRDPVTGEPVGDKNVLLAPVDMADELREERGEINETTKDQEENSEIPGVRKDLVDMRTQFSNITGRPLMYVVDPKRDQELKIENDTVLKEGPLQRLDLDDGEPIFPISDERGYEVIGSYPYGRLLQLDRDGIDFQRQASKEAKELLHLEPDTIFGDDVEPRDTSMISVNDAYDIDGDAVFKTDPNNYPRNLSQLQPTGDDSYNYVSSDRDVAGEGGQVLDPAVNVGGSPPQDTISTLDVGSSSRAGLNSRRDQVAMWQIYFDDVREARGVTEEQYPDEVLLALIAVESNGDPSARRREPTEENPDRMSQYCGLLQIGHLNAEDLGAQNTDFLGDDVNDIDAAIRSLDQFIGYSEKYSSGHNYDPEKIAINWKGGPGTVDNFNAAQSDEQRVQVLKDAWGADQYLAHFQRARGTYRGTEVTLQTPEEIPPEDVEEDINEVGFPPEIDPDTEARLSSNFFAKALEDNLDEEVLPSDIETIRDPSLMSHINDFLKVVYERGILDENRIERELRGQTQNTRPPGRANVNFEDDED